MKRPITICSIICILFLATSWQYQYNVDYIEKINEDPNKYRKGSYYTTPTSQGIQKDCVAKAMEELMPNNLLEKYKRCATTAVIMYDTRSPLVEESGNYTFWKSAAMLNYDYAQRHNYNFIYMLDKNDQTMESSEASDGINSFNKKIVQCKLQLPNQKAVLRSVPWCKLLAIASAFDEGYEIVVYIESDAFFKSNAPSIEDIINKYGGSGLEKPLWVPNNSPYSPTRGNSGMQIWNQSLATSRALLNQWWKLDFSANKHPYEQSALMQIDWINNQSDVAQKKNLGDCGIGILDLPWMLSQQWKTLPAVHIPSDAKSQRETLMLTELKKIQPVSFKELQGSVKVINSTHFETKMNNDSTPFVCRGLTF